MFKLGLPLSGYATRSYVEVSVTAGSLPDCDAASILLAASNRLGCLTHGGPARDPIARHAGCVVERYWRGQRRENVGRQRHIRARWNLQQLAQTQHGDVALGFALDHDWPLAIACRLCADEIELRCATGARYYGDPVVRALCLLERPLRDAVQLVREHRLVIRLGYVEPKLSDRRGEAQVGSASRASGRPTLRQAASAREYGIGSGQSRAVRVRAAERDFGRLFIGWSR